MNLGLHHVAATAAFTLLAACGGGQSDPAPSIDIAGDGLVVPVSILATDCTAEKTTWQTLFSSGALTAALVDPYLPGSSPRRLNTSAWREAIPGLFNAVPGYLMRIDMSATGIRFGNCTPAGQEVTVSIAANFFALRSESLGWEPLPAFNLTLDLPMTPGQSVDPTHPFRTAQLSGQNLNVKQVESRIGPVDPIAAIPVSVWADYLSQARDPYMPPAMSCAAAKYFWRDWFIKRIFRVVVNDNNIADVAPVRMKADAWNGIIPEIPARYPGQDMEIEFDPIGHPDELMWSCVEGNPAKVTFTLPYFIKAFAVSNDQYSPLFTAVFSPDVAIDTTMRIPPRNPLAIAGASLTSPLNSRVPRARLLETFVDQFDIGVLNREWPLLVQTK